MRLSLRPFAYIGLAGKSMEDKEVMYTSDPPSEEMSALVRPRIDPCDYAISVIEILQNGASRNMIEYAHLWAKEDPLLKKALEKARISRAL